MPHTFSAEQWIPVPLEIAFAFFADPENLPRLMPAWQRARIESAHYVPPPPRPPGTTSLPGLVAGAGSRMTLTFRALPLLPLRLPWDAAITDFTWNQGFCDTIDGRGPFRSWRHCHTLTASPDATATLLSDHVTYTLPFRALGRLANTVAVRRQIRSIFRYRHQQTARLLPALAQSLATPR